MIALSLTATNYGGLYMLYFYESLKHSSIKMNGRKIVIILAYSKLPKNESGFFVANR
jgi:hypothetical protein